MFAGAYDGFGLARQHAGRGYDLRIWENFIVFFYGSVAHCGDCVLQDWFHEHKPSVAPHFRPYVPDALPTQWYKVFEAKGTEDCMWGMWFIHYMHVEQVVRSFVSSGAAVDCWQSFHVPSATASAEA